MKHPIEYYKNVIAENPKDEMGLQFQNAFGMFLVSSEATSTNMMELATRAFNTRLELSKSFNTNLYTDTNTTWENRIAGKTNSKCFSFGIKNHSRADSIWRFFNEKFPRSIALPVLFFKHSETNTTFSVEIMHERYFINHANDNDIPKLVTYLEQLWNKIFCEKTCTQNKLQFLAEFEWLWYWSNPFGRSGALIGDILSILLCEKLLSDGALISMRSEYDNYDLVALTSIKKDYINSRVTELTI